MQEEQSDSPWAALAFVPYGSSKSDSLKVDQLPPKLEEESDESSAVGLLLGDRCVNLFSIDAAALADDLSLQLNHFEWLFPSIPSTVWFGLTSECRTASELWSGLLPYLGLGQSSWLEQPEACRTVQNTIDQIAPLFEALRMEPDPLNVSQEKVKSILNKAPFSSDLKQWLELGDKGKILPFYLWEVVFGHPQKKGRYRQGADAISAIFSLLALSGYFRKVASLLRYLDQSTQGEEAACDLDEFFFLQAEAQHDFNLAHRWADRVDVVSHSMHEFSDRVSLEVNHRLRELIERLGLSKPDSKAYAINQLLTLLKASTERETDDFYRYCWMARHGWNPEQINEKVKENFAKVWSNALRQCNSHQMAIDQRQLQKIKDILLGEDLKNEDDFYRLAVSLLIGNGLGSKNTILRAENRFEDIRRKISGDRVTYKLKLMTTSMEVKAYFKGVLAE